MNEMLIDAEQIKKSFGEIHAVDGVDLRVKAGEIYGLVGSDGAGKTTTMRLLIGALKADSGTVSLCGYSIDRQIELARSVTGYLSQRFSLYEDLTVLENIRFFAEVRGISASEWYPRCLELLNFVGLANFKDRLAGQLSGGMKQKLGLASALVSRPRVLLLDEPTTGVDPVTRQDFWQLIIRLVADPVNGNGVCVLLSTPYMDEASRCHRVGFMRKGKIIAEGTPAQLCTALGEQILELRGSPLSLLKHAAAQQPAVKDIRAFGDCLHLRCQQADAEGLVDALRKAVPAAGGVCTEARLVAPTLEDVFIALSESQQ